MTSLRTLSPADLSRLKSSTRAVVTRAGGAVSVAGLLGVAHQVVSRWGAVSEDSASRFMPADAIAELVRDTGDLSLVAALAAHGNAVVTRLPDAGEGQIAGAARSAALEAGEITGAIIAALSDDGRVDAGEARDLIPLADRLVETVTQLRALLGQRAMDEGEGDG